MSLFFPPLSLLSLWLWISTCYLNIKKHIKFFNMPTSNQHLICFHCYRNNILCVLSFFFSSIFLPIIINPNFPSPLNNIMPTFISSSIFSAAPISIPFQITAVQSTSSSFVLPNITSLVSIKHDADNHLAWKSQFEPILICNDMLSHADGSFLYPPIVTDQNGIAVVNPSYSSWVKTDQCVRILINLTFIVQIFHEVHALQTSRGDLLALGQHFTYCYAAKEIELKLDF